jgi:hypothetical protein
VNDAVVNIDTAVAEPEPEATPRFRVLAAPSDQDSEPPEPGRAGFIIDPAGYTSRTIT